jgi:hypothetical protein
MLLLGVASAPMSPTQTAMPKTASQCTADEFVPSRKRSKLGMAWEMNDARKGRFVVIRFRDSEIAFAIAGGKDELSPADTVKGLYYGILTGLIK